MIFFRKMSAPIWKYFTKSVGNAFCKQCEYQINFPPSAPTTTLIKHLQRNHKKEFAEYEATKTAKTNELQQPRPKRDFFASGGGLGEIGSLLIIIFSYFLSDLTKNEEAPPNKQLKIEQALKITSLNYN